jgi:hypothetical protein
MKKQYVNRSEPSWIATQREDGNYNLQRADQEYYTVQFKSFIESSNKWIPREEVKGDLWSAFRANPRKETPKEIDLKIEQWRPSFGSPIYHYGTGIYLNNKKVDFNGVLLEGAVKAVLEHLGYKVNEV